MLGTLLEPPFDLVQPALQSAPLVVASPHSGRIYPQELVGASCLAAGELRQCEDCFVDDIFAAAPRLGIPLLAARFARAFVDVNREPWELDPAMFEDELPDFVNSASARVAAGFGTVPRIVGQGQPIYGRKLRFAEVRARIESCHFPYHGTLRRLVEATAAVFGTCLLIDAHSMPSALIGRRGAVSRPPADIVLGDRNGVTCAAAIVDAVEAFLRGRGYVVARNNPYAGAFTAQTYGQPACGRHCLQIEIDRALYLDERSYERKRGFPTLAADMADLLGALAAMDLPGGRAVAAGRT